MLDVEADGLTGIRLAAARKDARLTQRALATTLGVTLRTVQNYESGKIVPYRHLADLSALLGRPIGWLLTGQTQPLADDLLSASRRQRAMLTDNLERLRLLSRELNDRGATQADLLATHAASRSGAATTT